MNAAASTNKLVGDVLSTAWKKDEFKPHSLINHAGFVKKTELRVKVHVFLSIGR